MWTLPRPSCGASPGSRPAGRRRACGRRVWSTARQRGAHGTSARPGLGSRRRTCVVLPWVPVSLARWNPPTEPVRFNAQARNGCTSHGPTDEQAPNGGAARGQAEQGGPSPACPPRLLRICIISATDRMHNPRDAEQPRCASPQGMHKPLRTQNNPDAQAPNGCTSHGPTDEQAPNGGAARGVCRD